MQLDAADVLAPMLSLYEVATILGVHVETVRRLIKSRELRSMKVMGRRVVDPVSVRSFIRRGLGLVTDTR